MAAQPTATSQVISETAKSEGGPAKGSTSAQMQSEVGKTRNFEQAAQEIGNKMQNAPEAVTSEDANYLKSREARAIGQSQPPAESISSDAQHLAAVNEGAARPSHPTEQSAQAKIQNYAEVGGDVAQKLATNPEDITKDDANLAHSREQRAHGHTEKGGVAAQAQSQAAKNEGAV
ncbi:hypothetical protein EJ03DRAFT_351276 [Teratosphaeria nubilosa]|uniref:SMP domain-containing protein n=1 Tax=Teratosphaeria nubilosa TaxID=161662 RepID=A0A6G1L9M2_9PEZI|nr:hypothetical protein EJ03DRAFT_351276 [Teratosphaeria nubilosa]